MKIKPNLLLVVLMFGGTACSESIDFKNAAIDLCECMETKDSIQNGEYDLSRDLHYNSCILELKLASKIDISSEEFEKVLEEQCSDLIFLHNNYLESLNG